jgi:hypothetical protein
MLPRVNYENIQMRVGCLEAMQKGLWVSIFRTKSHAQPHVKRQIYYACFSLTLLRRQYLLVIILPVS